MHGNPAPLRQFARHVSKQTLAPALFYMTDPRSDYRQIITGLPAGSVVIARHYDADARCDVLTDIVRHSRQYGHMALIADSPHTCRQVGADGIHIPGFRIPQLARWQSQLKPQHRISMACHSLQDVRRAIGHNVHWPILSPFAATVSHPGQSPVNRHQLLQLCHAHPGRLVLLGGIQKADLPYLQQLPIAGIAGISIFNKP